MARSRPSRAKPRKRTKAGAGRVRGPLRHGHMERLRIDSAALRGNALGDPHERDVFVYTPPDHDDHPGRRYPCVIVLTGFLGIGENPWQKSFRGEALHERMDRLIHSGACKPMVLAVPDCITSLGGSQYVDSAAIGNYETFVIDEVVPFVDAHAPTLAAAAHRGVCGKSSGGYGALMLGMKHPKVFGALASHSGDAYFDYCYGYDFVKCWDGLRRAGGVEKWLRAFRKKPKLLSADVAVLNIVAMAAAYSPDPLRPGEFDLPFDLETGEPVEAVLRRWRKVDPVVACRRYARNLKRMRGVFLDCGLKDEYTLHAGTRILASRLRALGVEHVHEEFEDGHMGISYRYDVSLPFLSKVLS